MLTVGVCQQLNIPHSFDYGLLAFLTTLVVYNFQRIVKHAQSPNPSPHLVWVARYQPHLFVLSTISFFGAALLFFHLYNWTLSSLVLLGIGGIISFFYIVRIGKYNLRELPHLKIHLIAITWVLIIGVFPLLNEGMLDHHSILFVTAHYLYILAVTIPFDVRDLKYDNRNQMTFPQLLGFKGALVLAILLVIIFVGIVFFIQPELRTNPWFWLSILCTLLLIIRTNETRKDYYFGGLIDGIIFFLGLSYCFT